MCWRPRLALNSVPAAIIQERRSAAMRDGRFINLATSANPPDGSDCEEDSPAAQASPGPAAGPGPGPRTGRGSGPGPGVGPAFRLPLAEVTAMRQDLDRQDAARRAQRERAATAALRRKEADLVDQRVRLPARGAARSGTNHALRVT